MVSNRKTTPAEQRLADQVALERYTHCLAEINERGLEGCARLAYEQAAAFVQARRNYIHGQQP